MQLVQVGRANETAYVGDTIGGNACKAGVLPNSVFVWREVNAIDLILCDVTVEPLLDLRSRLEHTAPGDVQRELAELIAWGTRFQGCSRLRKKTDSSASGFWHFFGVVSLLLIPGGGTLNLIGEAQLSTACVPRG